MVLMILLKIFVRLDKVLKIFKDVILLLTLVNAMQHFNDIIMMKKSRSV